MMVSASIGIKMKEEEDNSVLRLIFGHFATFIGDGRLVLSPRKRGAQVASWQMVLTTARVTKGFGFSLVDLLPRRIIVRGSLNDKVAKLIASTRLYLTWCGNEIMH